MVGEYFLSQSRSFKGWKVGAGQNGSSPQSCVLHLNGSFLLCNNFGFLLLRELLGRHIFHSLFKMCCTDHKCNKDIFAVW